MKLFFRILFLPALTFCMASVANGQVFGEAARTEFFGGLGIRPFYSRVNRTQLLIDGVETSNPDAPKVFVNSIPVAVVYGALPRLSLIAVVPSISRTLERTVNEQRLSETDFGIGDITLFAKYRFYKKDAFLKSRQISIQVGLKLPTGADDLEDGQGNRLPQPLQLGTGSVDTRFTLTFTEARNRLIFSGDLGYTLRTEANDFEFGNVFNYDFAVKFRFHPSKFTDYGSLRQHFVFLELNGSVSEKAKTGGNKIADSGGHQIFLAPGFQLFLLENFLFEGGIQIPILRNLNGTQLGTDFNLRTGFRWIISP